MMEVLWLVGGLWIGAAAGAVGTGLFVGRRRAAPVDVGEALASVPEGWGEFLQALASELRTPIEVLARKAALLADRAALLAPEQVSGLALEISIHVQVFEGQVDELEALAAAAVGAAAQTRRRGVLTAAPAAGAPPWPAELSATGPVLVVEDDAWIRELVATALQSAGFAVLEAADGLAALDLVEQHRPAAIVLDLMLPRMNGVVFAEELGHRGLCPGVPIVVLSALGDAREVAEQIGAEAYLSKPFQVAELVGEVARIAA